MPSEQPSVQAFAQPLMGLSMPVPNEARLQELHRLLHDKTRPAPGPGSYEVSPQEFRAGRRTFRRQHDPQLDGPFFLQEGEASTRVRETARAVAGPSDSGLGPGQYTHSAPQKDATLKRGPAASIGTASREGRTPHTLALSVSRSIQHGLDWHARVIVVTAPQADSAPPPLPVSAPGSPPPQGAGSWDLAPGGTGTGPAATGRVLSAAHRPSLTNTVDLCLTEQPSPSGAGGGRGGQGRGRSEGSRAAGGGAGPPLTPSVSEEAAKAGEEQGQQGKERRRQGAPGGNAEEAAGPTKAGGGMDTLINWHQPSCGAATVPCPEHQAKQRHRQSGRCSGAGGAAPVVVVVRKPGTRPGAGPGAGSTAATGSPASTGDDNRGDGREGGTAARQPVLYVSRRDAKQHDAAMKAAAGAEEYERRRAQWLAKSSKGAK